MRLTIPGIALVAGFALMIFAVLTFNHPPVRAIERGAPGVGMQVEYNPSQLAALQKANMMPAILPAAAPGGPLAGNVYKNVQVLKNVPVGSFVRLMVSMTNWIAPQQGCGYCHVAGNFAADTKYTKVVARRMLQMTMAVNADYQTHVGAVGVTCYTCHRGNPVPVHWFSGPQPGMSVGVAESDMGKNLPAAAADFSSLPSDPFTPFLLGNPAPIRVEGTTALPTGNRQSIKQTDWTYALMMHYSTALGVNCAFCHNTRAFGDWSESTPQRVKAWYGLRMVRDLNLNYMVPLTPVFPADQRGPLGDVAKINCATCHLGVYKPMFGAKMAASFPELEGPSQVSATGSALSAPPMAPPMPMGTTAPATNGAKP
ncbi:MAG: photosynthetic reaction center cytochrome c subunit [Rhodospirillales bacterium 20-60-12]|jgi:photosynthetic reaction center cytochrome c subunit|nr:MAG: photosynthetic reaction center cytochrome c subunit [Rhodospirillales bacterium 20-60-12]HQT68320.1 photosynthetic reaction center cytochrome PufC [Acetobacteraceae bacterium]